MSVPPTVKHLQVQLTNGDATTAISDMSRALREQPSLRSEPELMAWYAVALDASGRSHAARAIASDVLKVTQGSPVGAAYHRMLGAMVSSGAEQADLHDRWERLSSREQQVAQLLCHGLTDQHIAADLGISVRTAECHVGRILRKLQVPSRAAAAVAASRVEATRLPITALSRNPLTPPLRSL